MKLFNVHSANYFSKGFLVIDALDDCPNDPEKSCLDRFFEELGRLSDFSSTMEMPRGIRTASWLDSSEAVPSDAIVSLATGLCARC
jgi:predicted Abi (CAAX) family protease